jgi:hypothetical protein
MALAWLWPNLSERKKKLEKVRKDQCPEGRPEGQFIIYPSLRLLWAGLL